MRDQLLKEIKEYSGVEFTEDWRYTESQMESIHFHVKMAYLYGVTEGLQKAQQNFVHALEGAFKPKPECKHEQVEPLKMGGYQCVFCSKWLAHSEVDQ